VTSPWRDLREQAEYLLLLIAYGVIALGFFGALVLATMWLTKRGYGVVADVLVLNYVLVSTPIFLTQIAVVFDLLLTWIGIASVVAPTLQEVADQTSAGPVTKILASILSTVSLFSSVSTWALGLVSPPATARELARIKYRTEAAVLAASFARLRRSASR
jgi:hypothetical protein